MIPQDVIEAIRQQSDIAEVIGDRIELRRGRSARCPFHDDRSPSFSIDPSRQRYKCFGCGASGDVFAFVMAYDHVGFYEAVRILGDRAGIDVASKPRESVLESERQSRVRSLAALYDALRIAQEYYSAQLATDAGRAALEYLGSRGISREIVDAFGIGYAPASWGALADTLHARGVTRAEAFAVDLIVERRSGVGHFDRLRDRIVFPIHDRDWRVTALVGRTMPGAPQEAPKYLNTSNSPVHMKHSVCYGVAHAQDAILQGDTPILVEGCIDTVVLHAHGFRSTLGLMGTAISSGRNMLLRALLGDRSDVVLLFDGDAAGREGAEHARDRLRDGGLHARTALLPDGTDPDTFVCRYGADALAELIDRAV